MYPRIASILASAAALTTTYAQFLSPVPAAYENVSAVLIANNLAVIPGEWNVTDLEAPFYEISTRNASLSRALNQSRNADFIAFDPSFFDIIGPDATLERILDFPGVEGHVHEAPVYLPQTNELIFSDTSAVGWLWAIDVDTYETRNITSSPPLSHVNGGTYNDGRIYFTTNGSPVRGLYQLNPSTGATTALLNNYRGRHFNSPNDMIFDANGNIWFTDPTYGWDQAFEGVQPPELPNSIYFFNVSSGALTVASSNVVLYPNGLALSEDESTLYVSETNSTSGRPLQQSPSSVRSIYAFNVTGSVLTNPRVVFGSEAGWPDGLRVTSGGYIIAGALGGADVIDPTTGVLLGKINCPDDIIFNVEPIRGTGTWFLTGGSYIYKVQISETGLGSY